MIQPHTIQEILNTARIEEIVSDFVNLKKRGANYLGNCPFHNEKTPSFTVSPAKGIYKCFGCGKAGNSVSFIMEHEKLTYPEALKYVAKKYGITVEEEAPSPEMLAVQDEQESIFNLTTFAQKYFTDQLINTEEGKAIGLSYLYERGFSDEIIEKFQIGYCQDTWETFSKHAMANGYKRELLIKTGLSSGKDDKLFDFFRGRVIFPIHNISGRVLGFTGRLLKQAENTGKYVNSPETPVFQKRLVLYGLYQAKTSISTQNRCYLVEGQADVVAMHQAGITNTVASSGTALTAEQIKMIRRYTKDITLLYDGDAAGIKASLRAIDIIIEEGMNIKLVLIPGGDDPDSYIKKNSAAAFKTFIEDQAIDFIRFKTQLLVKDIANDPVKKAEVIKEIVTTISLIPDGITRSMYIKDCSRIMDVQEQVLLNELNKLRKKKIQAKVGGDDILAETVVPSPVQTAITSDSPLYHPEFQLLRMLIQYGKHTFTFISHADPETPQTTELRVADYVINDLQKDDIEFSDPVCKKIFSLYCEQYDQGSIADDTFFIQYNDPIINRFVIDLLEIPYTISTHWEDKLDIRLSKEIEKIQDHLDFYLYSLKNEQIESLIKQKFAELSEASEEERMLLLHDYSMLLKIRNQIASYLGDRVILK